MDLKNSLVKCDFCAKEQKPFKFLVKYCEKCKKYICRKCWDFNHSHHICPICSATLTELSDKELSDKLSKLNKNITNLYQTLHIESSCIPKMSISSNVFDDIKLALKKSKKKMEDKSTKQNDQ